MCYFSYNFIVIFNANSGFNEPAVELPTVYFRNLRLYEVAYCNGIITEIVVTVV